MGTEYDPITIVLVDDNPGSLQTGGAMPRVNAAPWEKYFTVLWLATIDEARNYRDAFRAITLRSPTLLNKAGLVPDVVLFDYALAGNCVPVKRRQYVSDEDYRAGSPLPRIERVLQSLDLALAPLSEFPQSQTPQRGTSRGRIEKTLTDNYGCYAGGLILEACFGHPCAGVPTTVWGSDKTAGTEAEVFEWLLERDAGPAFREKGRGEPRWEKLIPYSMSLLRKSIERLDDAGIITLSLDDLLAMTDLASDTAVLRVWSRFGLRRMPLAPLFADRDDEQRMTARVKWAESRLQLLTRRLSLVSVHTDVIRNYKKAEALADEVWQIYEESDLSLRRWRLHELAIKRQNNSLASDEEDEYNTELAHWVPADTHEVTPEISLMTIAKAAGAEGWAIRWAVIFLVLRLHAWKSRAKDNYIDGTDRFGPSHRLLGFDTDVAVDEVFRLLFPIPGGPPIIPTLSTSKSRDLSRLNSTDRAPLPSKPNRRKDGNTGNLALRIEHILHGMSWLADGSTPRTEWQFGLIPGETHLFRSFALRIGLAREDVRPFVRTILG